MKRLISLIGVLGILLVSLIAQADTGAILDINKRAYFVSRSGYKMTIGTVGSDTFSIIASGTPVASVDSSGFTFASPGQGIAVPTYVPTLAATPVAGTNIFNYGLNVVPTNAANNAGLLHATPVPGKPPYVIVNAAGAAIRVKAGGTATLNGATAGGYISVASLASVRCYATSTSNYNCEQPVIPTPAGP